MSHYYFRATIDFTVDDDDNDEGFSQNLIDETVGIEHEDNVPLYEQLMRGLSRGTVWIDGLDNVEDHS